jgi:hypothetical protein
MKRINTVLFHRDFRGFTGGHLKVWDYYQYIQSSNSFHAEIYFTPESVWQKNPWNVVKNKTLTKWLPYNSDILFLAGMDWLALSENNRKKPPSPIVNLVQHVRHADRNNPLYGFLKYPATRICVSQEVADAVLSTGKVNGAIVVSPNGIDHALLPSPLAVDKKDIPLLIIALKNPSFANELAKQLLTIGINPCVIVEHLHRYDFLTLINRSRVVIFLPHKTEGFYLPALEAMYLKSLVICPDCIGNRGFCLNNITCLMPDYTCEEIINSVKMAFSLPTKKKNLLINKAHSYAQDATLEQEKIIFFNVLSSLV